MHVKLFLSINFSILIACMSSNIQHSEQIKLPVFHKKYDFMTEAVKDAWTTILKKCPVVTALMQHFTSEKIQTIFFTYCRLQAEEGLAYVPDKIGYLSLIIAGEFVEKTECKELNDVHPLTVYSNFLKSIIDSLIKFDVANSRHFKVTGRLIYTHETLRSLLLQNKVKPDEISNSQLAQFFAVALENGLSISRMLACYSLATRELSRWLTELEFYPCVYEEFLEWAVSNYPHNQGCVCYICCQPIE